jgi:paraquat-inducible protein B
LESLVGPRLVLVDAPTLDKSASTAVQVEFVGLSEAPFIERREVGDLTIQLQANLRGSLQPGAAVFYRGVKIGTIVAATLAGDAMTVDVSALIKARYAPLVRVNSRFYQTGALEELGLTGLRARLDSLETLLVGGVTLVTPTEYGEPCKPGAEFKVTAKAKDEWLLWRPQIELD